MYNILPLFKSHYSLGKSIMTLEKPSGKPNYYPTTIFDLLAENKLDTLVLVDDNISGLLQASKQAKESKVKLVFGLRLYLTDDMTQKDDIAILRRAKYIIFAKNPRGYQALVKIWSKAARDGFYYKPSMDFKTLKGLWSKDLSMAVPFYDSFLHLNTLNSHVHVPDFSFASPVFLKEDNDLPFDFIIDGKVDAYCKDKYQTLPAQSIYYRSPDDFEAYVTFRCIHHRGHAQKSTLERPELDHMGSNQFNFEKWLARNKQ